MTYDILATGSSGNAVVINGEILIDCGVPMKKLRESGYIKSLKLVLLTHEHSDHMKLNTILHLHYERPTLRFGCCEWMVPHLLEAGVDKQCIYPFKIGKTFSFCNGTLDIIPDEIPHDVRNCCYSIHFWNPLKLSVEKLFYATDTSTLDHIEAKNYDLYLIEANHTRAEIEARIKEKQARGEFAYELRAARNHLSQEQALDWLARNAGPNSRYVFLHQHKEKDGVNETNL